MIHCWWQDLAYHTVGVFVGNGKQHLRWEYQPNFLRKLRQDLGFGVRVQHSHRWYGLRFEASHETCSVGMLLTLLCSRHLTRNPCMCGIGLIVWLTRTNRSLGKGKVRVQAASAVAGGQGSPALGEPSTSSSGCSLWGYNIGCTMYLNDNHRSASTTRNTRWFYMWVGTKAPGAGSAFVFRRNCFGGGMMRCRSSLCFHLRDPIT